MLAQIEARLATLRDTLAEKAAETTFTVAIIEGSAQLWLFTETNFGAQLALEAGLSLPETAPTAAEVFAATGSNYASSVTLEQLPMIEAGHIFMFTNWNSGIEKELFANPVWQNFAASNPERIHFLNGEYWVRDHPISAHRILDDLFRYVAGVNPAEVSPNPFTYAYPQPEGEISAGPDMAATPLTCDNGFRPFDHELLIGEPLCIPAAPQRIVALDMASVELVLLLGQTPIATSDWILDEMPLLLPQYADTLAGVEDVGYPASLEKLLLLKPDIILATDDTLDAVKANKAFFTPGYWWRSQSYLLANKVIDDLFTHLTDTTATTAVLD